MDEKDENIIAAMIARNETAITQILNRLERAVRLLHNNDTHKYIHIRVQLDNEGYELLDLCRCKDHPFYANIVEDSEPQIAKDADLFLECQIEHLLRMTDGGLQLEDAIIRTKLTIRPTLKPLIMPGQLARALQGKIGEDDKDLQEPVKCLRCGTGMYIVGPEHHVQDHGKDLIIELWACDGCDYLEYRRGKKGRKGFV